MTTTVRKSGVRKQYHKEQTAEKISLTTKYGMYKAAENGYAVSRPPYGYKILPNKRLEKDLVAAEVVSIIFSWSENGLGVRKIVQMLKEMGILTPSEYQSNTKNPNCNWNTVTVLRMLRNEVYTGVLTYGTHSINGDILKIVDNHTPIISKEQFNNVQDILSKKNNKVS